jgi:hypothetical protein
MRTSAPDDGTSTSSDAADAWQGNHRALAALALGLAYSDLDDPTAVQQLRRSGDPEQLQRARRAVTDASGVTDPSVLARAHRFLDEALVRSARVGPHG